MVDVRTENVLRTLACNADERHRISAYQLKKLLEPNSQKIIDELIDVGILHFIKDDVSDYYQYSDMGWRKFGNR